MVIRIHLFSVLIASLMVLSGTPTAMAAPSASQNNVHAITLSCRKGLLTALRDAKSFSYKSNAEFLMQNLHPKAVAKVGNNQFAFHDAAQHLIPATKRAVAKAPQHPIFAVDERENYGEGGVTFDKSYDFQSHSFSIYVGISDPGYGDNDRAGSVHCKGGAVVDITADNGDVWNSIPLKMGETAAQKFIKRRTEQGIAGPEVNNYVYLVWKVHITGLDKVYNGSNSTHLVLGGHILSATIYGDKQHRHVLAHFDSPPDPQG